MGQTVLESIISTSPMVALRRRATEGWPVEFISSNIERFGYTPEDFYTGRLNYSRLIHPKDLDKVKSEVSQFVKEGAAEFSQEYRIVTKSNEVRWVDERTSICRAPDGAVSFFQGIVLDVTSRKLAEAALQKACTKLTARMRERTSELEGYAENLKREAAKRKKIEHELRRERDFSSAVLATSGALVVVLDRSGRIVLFNRACERVTGYSFEEVANKEIWNLLLAPEEVPEVRSVFDNLKAGHFPNEHENYWITKKGDRRFISWSNTVLTDDEGNVEYVIATGIDITERRRAEESLQKSEERLKLIIETIPSAVTIFDPHGRIIFVNQTAEQILGRPHEKIIGHTFEETSWNIFTPDGRPFPVKDLPFAQVKRTGKPVYGVEHVIERPDGTRIALSSNATPFPVPHGAVLMVCQNITYRFELDRMKAEFLNIASHELRTPLTPLRLLIQQSLRRLEQGQSIEVATMRRMQRQVDHLASMINDLLDVSRIERGTLIIRPALIDLRDLVSSVVENFRIEDPRRNIVTEMPEEVVDVEADSTRIEQVLANLIDNALKFSPQGAPVEVRALPIPDGVRVSVTDHGPGIPKDRQKELFSRFYKTRPDVLRRQQGLGLGLYISKEIVLLHGGTIGVDSEPGAGSTFYFVLPRAQTIATRTEYSSIESSSSNNYSNNCSNNYSNNNTKQ